MKLASIETIKDIRPHSNADRLEIATVLGWQVIVGKGEFSVGDKVVFICIDTILPDAPWSEFLKKDDKPIRLRSIKLRGEYSQGLVLPLLVLSENVQGWQVGADVSGELGVKKYEKEIPAQLSGEIKGSFPEYLVSRTDEDNGLSYPDIVDEVLKYPKLCITQKLDGSSMTVIVRDGEIEHVCSRRISLKDDGKNSFWAAAKKLDLPTSGEFAIQGELMGPGIQGNQLELSEPEMFIFQIKELGRGEWFRFHDENDEMDVYCFARVMGAQTVPIMFSDMKDATLDKLKELSQQVMLKNGKPAEGIVVRPVECPARGDGRPLSFKLINPNYGE